MSLQIRYEIISPIVSNIHTEFSFYVIIVIRTFNFDYFAISHLRTEARQKLARIQPVNVAQASRISGVTPADLALVIAHLEGKAACRRSRPDEEATPDRP